MNFTIYTDGSSFRNGFGGPGGFAAVCVEDDSLSVRGGAASTTNNRMEMMAAIEGLDALPEGSSVLLVTDSEYLALGYTQYMKKWLLFKGQNGKWPSKLKNPDLWDRLILSVGRHASVEWQVVKGHSTSKWNNLADERAGEEAAAWDA